MERPSPPAENNRNERKILAAAVITTILMTAAISFDLSPFLRGPDEWRWPYAVLASRSRVILPLAFCLLYFLIGNRWAKRLIQHPVKKVITFLAYVWICSAVIQLLMLSLTNPPIQQLFFRAASAGASGVFSVSSTIENPHDFLSQYPQIMPTFPVHPQRYPPGLMMIFYWFRGVTGVFSNGTDTIVNNLRLLQCTDWGLMRLSNQVLGTVVLQMALPLLSSLVVFPLFYLGKLTIKRPAAIWAVLFYPLIPSFVLWAGVWDQFYPLITAGSALCFGLGLAKKRSSLMFLSGLILGLGTFLSFGLIGLLAPFGLWAVFHFLANYDFREQSFWTQIVLQGGAFTLGLVFIWLLYQLVYGVSFLQIWNVSMGYHLGLPYDYWTWVLYHPYDFFLFLGIPLTILFGVAAYRSFSEAITKRTPASLFCLSFFLAFVVLVLSGTSRGEVSRVWLFLTPLAILCAAWLMPKFSAQAPLILGLLMIGQLLVFNSNFRIVTTGMLDPVAYDRQFELPDQMTPIAADFGSELTLLGFNLAETTPGAINLTLHWQATQFVAKPYSEFVHVVDSNQEIVAQTDSMPQSGAWPTTCWQPAEVVSDQFSFELPPGKYTVYTGLYWFEDGQRVQIEDGPTLNHVDNRLFLTDFEVN